MRWEDCKVGQKVRHAQRGWVGEVEELAPPGLAFVHWYGRSNRRRNEDLVRIRHFDLLKTPADRPPLGATAPTTNTTQEDK